MSSGSAEHTVQSVLMVNTYHHLRGGDSRCMFETAGRLRSRGIAVHHFAMQHDRNEPCEEARYFAPHVDYPELLARGGLTSKFAVLKSSLHNAQARSALRSLLCDVRVDLAHLHSVMHHLTASVVLELRERRTPVVWTLHDYKSVCPTTRMLRDGRPCHDCRDGLFFEATRHRCKRDRLGPSLITTLELYLHRWWRIYEQADLLIAPSRFLRDTVLEMGLRPRRIEVLPNFVQADAIAPRQDDEGYVLYVGRLSPEKGLPNLVEAAGRLGTLELRIAGTGELEDSLRATVRARGWEHVRFEGHAEGGKLSELYRGARAVLVPSEWYENCPMVVLEAFAHGKPVVGSRLGGLVDLVEPEVTGALVPAGDVGAWAAVLEDLRDRPERWRQMGAEARRRAQTRYGDAAHVRTLLELYDSVLRDRSERGG